MRECHCCNTPRGTETRVPLDKSEGVVNKYHRGLLPFRELRSSTKSLLGPRTEPSLLSNQRVGFTRWGFGHAERFETLLENPSPNLDKLLDVIMDAEILTSSPSPAMSDARFCC
jgi:hypothetical protein